MTTTSTLTSMVNQELNGFVNATVTFRVRAETNLGDHVYLVGSGAALGSWKPQAGIALRTHEEAYPLWWTTIQIPLDSRLKQSIMMEYKFVIRRNEGQMDWEDGANRVLPLSLRPDGNLESTPSEMAVFGENRDERLQSPTLVPVMTTSTCLADLTSDSPDDMSQSSSDSSPQPVKVASSTPKAKAKSSPYSPFNPIARPSPRPSTRPSPTPSSVENSPTPLKIVRVPSKPVSRPKPKKSPSVEVDNQVASKGKSPQAPVAKSPQPAPVAKSPTVEEVAKPPQDKKETSAQVVKEKPPAVKTERPPQVAKVESVPEPIKVTSSLEDVKVESAKIIPVSPQALKPQSIKPTNPRYFFNAGAHRLAKPAGRCEDAFFFSTNAAGVADGVGQMEQFKEYGVDAAAYSDELMRLCAEYMHENPTGSPNAALASAEQGAKSFGASTALVMTLEGQIVRVANLGDSGFMHLRSKDWGMEIVQTSREQTHGWNCPYQLTRVPEELIRGTGVVFDSAADCDLYDLHVAAGDLLLLFTDGLTDNLHWHEVVRKVDEVLERKLGQGGHVPPEEVAQALAAMAEVRSHDTQANTPFAQSARRNRLHFPGGKEDDITVVAAWIQIEENNQGHQQKDVTVGTLEMASARKTCILS